MKNLDSPLMIIQATPNEIIAINAVVTDYRKHHQGNKDLDTFLEQFQRRLIAYLPDNAVPIAIPAHASLQFP